MSNISFPDRLNLTNEQKQSLENVVLAAFRSDLRYSTSNGVLYAQQILEVFVGKMDAHNIFHQAHDIVYYNNK